MQPSFASAMDAVSQRFPGMIIVTLAGHDRNNRLTAGPTPRYSEFWLTSWVSAYLSEIGYQERNGDASLHFAVAECGGYFNCAETI